MKKEDKRISMQELIDFVSEFAREPIFGSIGFENERISFKLKIKKAKKNKSK